jgi:hypothetical protein
MKRASPYSFRKLATPFARGEDMEKLKRLALSFTLMSVVAVATLAGDTNSPPCTPGETSGPPCSQAVTDSSTDPGETNAPPSNAVDLTTIAEAVQLALSLF